jgi:hypothetical protein
MDDAFSRNAKKGVRHTGTNGHAYRPSPSSETEMDEPGITFVPKKYQNGSTQDDQANAGRGDEFDAEGATARILSASQDLDREERMLMDKTRVIGGMHSTPQLTETPKGSGSRQAGTPITETELMRRRRLLDSHIFE